MDEFYRVEIHSEYEPDQELLLISDKLSFRKIQFIRTEYTNSVENFILLSGKTFEIPGDEDLRERISRHYADNVQIFISRIEHKVGMCFPRIYRPQLELKSGFFNFRIMHLKHAFNYNQINSLPIDIKSMLSGIQRFEILLNELLSIFQTVYPNESNHNAFGDKLRNLLILACTEVETQFVGILRANDFSNQKPTVDDFHKLKEVLKLGEYRMVFTFYPDSSTFSPFKSWLPKESPLIWYQVYNKLKHEREAHFDQATLYNTINAVLAIPILLVAQYGNNIYHWREIVGKHLVISRYPEWDLKDCYLPPFKNHSWQEKKLFIKDMKK